jgi:hypothetical protein
MAHAASSYRSGLVEAESVPAGISGVDSCAEDYNYLAHYSPQLSFRCVTIGLGRVALACLLAQCLARDGYLINCSGPKACRDVGECHLELRIACEKSHQHDRRTDCMVRDAGFDLPVTQLE